jgi:8-oxo-dGTP diphosphatase
MTVRAAGGVVWRRAGDVELLLVHRPRYDDWSLPKGKRDPGETDEQCAVREVLEEAACACRLGVELLPNRYIDRKGRDKVVRWWTMTVVWERELVPNDEVDERRWLSAPHALALATYADDRDRIEAALATLA